VHPGAFFHRDGSGVRLSRPRPRHCYVAAALLPIVLALSLAVGVTRLFAAENVGPPSLLIDLGGVRSTRAFIEPHIDSNGSKTSWSLEVATGEKGPWTPLRSGTIDSAGNGLATRTLARHLTPDTPYYLRVVATNSSGTTVQTEIETKRGVKTGNLFTTLAIGSPEVFQYDEYASQHLPEGDEHDPVDELKVPGYVQCRSRVGSAECEAHVETNGAQTEYRFEYAPAEAGHTPPEGSASWQPFNSAGSGHVTVAEDFAEPKASVTGLTPETIYYVRFEAENEKDEKRPVVLTGSFATVTAAPRGGGSANAENVTATSAYLTSSVIPDDAETHYHFRYTTEPGNPASWVEVHGSAGTVPAAEATEEYVYVGAQLTGLHPGTVYYAGLFAENAHGELSSSTLEAGGFETAGPPAAVAFAVHSLRGEGALGVSGSVSANGTSTDEEQAVTVDGGATGGTFTLTFEGETTAPIPFVLKSGLEPQGGSSAQDEENLITKALVALPNIGTHEVTQKEGGQVEKHPNVNVFPGSVRGAYTIRFAESLAGKDLPQITADASGLAPSGTISVATVQVASPFDASYHVEYTTTDFANCGEPANPTCLMTPQVDLGPGRRPRRQRLRHRSRSRRAHRPRGR
jgi:hypothetical protein